MAEIAAVFFDIGGVLLTNGWDRGSRLRAIKRFDLDDGFEKRHKALAHDLDTGRLSLDAYLTQAVFCLPRGFSRDEFRTYMESCSLADHPMVELAAGAKAARRWLVGAVNNESLKLNRHRIETFDLRRCFDVFFSSCYLGLAKPDEAIYHRVIQLAQRRPEECVLIDDRLENVEAARRCDWRTVHFKDRAQLIAALAVLGVDLA